MRVHLAVEVGADRLALRYVHCNAGAAAGGRALRHVEHAPLAGHHGCDTRVVGNAARAPAGGLLAGGLVEQFEGSTGGILDGLGVDRVQVGLVGPDELVFRVADPKRVRDGVEQGRHGAQVGTRRGHFGAGPHELRAVAGHVPEPQDGAPADGAALYVDEGLRLSACREAKAFAPLLQGVESRLHGGRVARHQPRAEGERALHGRSFTGDRRIALEADLAVPARPTDHELALRADQQFGAVARAAESRQFGPQRTLTRAPAPTLPQKHQGGGGGKRHQSEEGGQVNGVVQVEVRQGTPQLRNTVGKRQIGGALGQSRLRGPAQQGRCQGGTEGTRRARARAFRSRLPPPSPGHAVLPPLRGPSASQNASLLQPVLGCR
jgi:hypothetical protein